MISLNPILHVFFLNRVSFGFREILKEELKFRNTRTFIIRKY